MIHSVRKAAYVLVTAVGLAGAGSASAAAITDSVSDSQKISKKEPYSFEHVLTTGHGFDVGSQAVTWALLTIVLDDDDGKDGYKIAVGSASHVVREGKDADLSFLLDAESLAGLSSTGKLEVTIWAKSCEGKKCGDGVIEFKKSTLEVTTAPFAPVPQAGDVPEAAAVPEPGTLSLLGLGLAAVAAMRGRRSRDRTKDQQ